MSASLARGQICPAQVVTDPIGSVVTHAAPPPGPSRPHRYSTKEPPGPDVFASHNFRMGHADETGARLCADVLDAELLRHLRAGALASVARTAGLLERHRPNVDSVAQARALRDAGVLPPPCLGDLAHLLLATLCLDGPRSKRLDFLLAFDELAAWASFARAPHAVLCALWHVATFAMLEALRAPWLWLDLVLEARRVLTFGAPAPADASRLLWQVLAVLANDEELQGLAELHGDPDLSRVRIQDSLQIDVTVEDVPPLPAPAIVTDAEARNTAPNRPLWLQPRGPERPRDPERKTKSASGVIGGERSDAAVLPC